MVPKSMLVDHFTYREFEGKGRSHNPTYKASIIIKHCRIDRTRQYHRDSEEAAVLAEATIYCYQAHTAPCLNFKEQSKVEFDDREYLVKNVRIYSEPFNASQSIVEMDVV